MKDSKRSPLNEVDKSHQHCPNKKQRVNKNKSMGARKLLAGSAWMCRDIKLWSILIERFILSSIIYEDKKEEINQKI